MIAVKKRNWYLTLGIVITAVMLLYIVMGMIWTPYEPDELSASSRYAAPSAQHLFGCDNLGRDVFSRTLDGAGTTLTIALAVLVIGFIFAKFVFKLSIFNNLGSITGGMTSTPALGALISTAGTDEVSAAYAATYPVALVAVVLAAKLLMLLA